MEEKTLKIKVLVQEVAELPEAGRIHSHSATVIFSQASAPGHSYRWSLLPPKVSLMVHSGTARQFLEDRDFPEPFVCELVSVCFTHDMEKLFVCLSSEAF